MGQADPILTRLGAGPAVKKLVETALVLSNSQDPQQRNHAYSFMESAIKELENDDNENKIKSLEEEGEEHKVNEEEDDHKIHEEELSNNNQGSRTGGSEPSTHNTGPYPGEGKDTTTGEKPMQDMDDTVNQWSETGGMITPGLPPTGSPGLDPSIAQELGMGMPPPPQMDTNQTMRQMQYTVKGIINAYHNKYVAPLQRTITQQKETIKKISTQMQETNSNSGNLRLDLDSMRKNANATFRETEPTEPSPFNGVPGVQPNYTRKQDQLTRAKSEIEEMNKMLNSNKNPMYN